MDPRCHIILFGSLRVVQSHQIVDRFRTQKTSSLLAYLALRRSPQPREQVIDLFWPDMDLAAGRSNLSTTLSNLRRQLEPPGVPPGSVLVASHASVGLNPAAVTTDVAEFERLLEQAETASTADQTIDILQRAMALCIGEFQPGNYQDWAVRESDRLHTRLVKVLDRLGEACEKLGRFAEASEAARRRVDADPYSEDAYVVLARRLLLAGRPGAAREAANSFEQFFRQEFGGGPSPEACRALSEIFKPVGLSKAESSSHEPAPQVPLREAMTAKARAQSPHTTPGVEPAPPASAIPFWLSRFLGREEEISRLVSLLLPAKAALSTDPPVRLVTLTGPGGAGKTRLSAELARQAVERLGHWFGFVPLVDLTEPEQIPAAIAQSLRLPPGRASEDRIADFFAGRDHPTAAQHVLVLDNLEQLIGEGEPVAQRIILDLLARSPLLVILCTSRRPLGLQGEHVVSLGPLEVPDAQWASGSADAVTSPEALEMLHRIPSVRLYLDRAQGVRPEFGLTAVNAGSIAALCRMLEGSPLALELAASWVRLLPPRRMVERLAQGLGVPESRHTDLPARQRSLDAALDWSWRLLSSHQQRFLAGLSAFRGGWDLEAAEAVGAEPDALMLLAQLQEASLVTSSEAQEGDIRYHLLESVRVFSRCRLEEHGERGEIERRHLAYFEELTSQALPELYGGNQAHFLDVLEAEHDNLRAALDWSAADPASHEAGLRLAAALVPFWRARGYLQEGKDRCAALLGDHTRATRSVARIDVLNGAGQLAALLADYTQGERFHDEALVISIERRFALGQADSLLGLGTVCYWRQDFDQAGSLFEQSLICRREAESGTLGDAIGSGKEAATYHSLGNLAIRQTDYTQAIVQFDRALALRRRIGDILGAAGTEGALGQVALAQGRHQAAAGHTAEALRLFGALGQRWTGAICLSGLSEITEARGEIAQSVRLLGAAAALRERYHFPQPPNEHAQQEQRLARLAGLAGPAAFNAAWAAGTALSWEQIEEQAKTVEEDTPAA